MSALSEKDVVDVKFSTGLEEGQAPATASAVAAAGLGPAVASTAPAFPVPKVTVVTPHRKEQLLLQARAVRRNWIEKVPLPYDIDSCMDSDRRLPTSAAAGNNLWTWSLCSSTTRCKSSLYKLNQSVLCQKYLPSATATISELYGLPTANHNTKSISAKALPSSRPLTLLQVAERVETLVEPYVEVDEDNASSTEVVSPSGDTSERAVMIQEYPSANRTQQKLQITSDPEVLEAYQDFWTSLLWPESSVLVQGMKNFIFNWKQNHFNNDSDSGPSITAAAASLKAYCKTTVETLAKSNQNLVGSSEYSSRLRRSLESFVYGQVRDILSQTIDTQMATPQGSNIDNAESVSSMTPTQFENRLVELQFIQPSHLEIACLQDDTTQTSTNDESQDALRKLLEDPIRALLSVNAYHSPFEKLQQILLVYQGVNGALSAALNQSNDTGLSVLPSADDVLPTIILVCIKAQPRHLLQNLHLIERFAAPEYLRGEAGYAFTNLYGAVQFIQELDLTHPSGNCTTTSKQQLSISPEELKQGLERCRKLRDEMMQGKNAPRSSDEYSNPLMDGRGLPNPLPEVKISVRDVHSAHLQGQMVDLEWARARQASQPQEAPSVSVVTNYRKLSLPDGFKRSYTFLNAQPSDIRLTDLSKLLEEYHTLVHVTEELLSERAARHATERKQRELEQQQTMGEKLLLGDS